MISGWMLWTLLVFYTVGSAAAVYDGHWPRFLYFVGSVVLTYGVLMMGRK